MPRLSGKMIAMTTVLTGALVVSAAPGAAARAEDTPPEFVSVEVLTPQVDVSTGWSFATVAVHLRDAEGLPDTMEVCCTDNNALASASREIRVPGAGFIEWAVLGRSSGTRRDGVWQGSAMLSPAWSGTYTVGRIQVDDDLNGTFVFPVENGPTITVSGGDTWAVTSVRTPIKVVTGDELWRPQARVTNTVTGVPVGGARVLVVSVFEPWSQRAALSEAPGTAADAAGLWTSPVTMRSGVTPGELGELRQLTYGRRGSRGWSMQGVGCVDSTVKLQASATYSAATLSLGQSLTVTGNAWPAPAILQVGGPIILQRDMGAAGWQTVASVHPRSNGRYTLTWQPSATGSYLLRVRWPGTGGPQPCVDQTVGTTLSTTPLTVR